MIDCAISHARKLPSARVVSTRYLSLHPALPSAIPTPLPATIFLKNNNSDMGKTNRHTKHTNAAMAQPPTSYPKKAKPTPRRWTLTTSKPRTTSSGKTTRLDASRMTPLIYTVNSWKKQNRFWNRGFDMRSKTDRRICMCKFSIAVLHGVGGRRGNWWLGGRF